MIPQATTGADAADGAPTPRALVAVTVHVYVLPVVNPVTVIGLAGPPLEPPTPPLLDTHDAVKPVIPLPLLAPGVNCTLS